MAERSKALVLGTSSKERGFESHHCQSFSQFSAQLSFFDTATRRKEKDNGANRSAVVEAHSSSEPDGRPKCNVRPMVKRQ